MIRRLQEQHERRLRRAEREFLDAALLALAASWRDVAVAASGGGPELLINIDRDPGVSGSAVATAATAGRAMGIVEQARADLADETNLNPRLILERTFLALAALRAEPNAVPAA